METAEFAQLLTALQHPQLKEIDLSLGRIERYLDMLGNPHLQLPPVIHIAGTNGKGSTHAFIRAILEAAGQRCHAFTSPHLVHFRERFTIASQPATDAQLLPLLRTIHAHADDAPLTFFEANAVAAFQLFHQHAADFTLLEVGMGGRFDATNVIPNPALTIITPIGMDHTEFLGDSLAAIAREKAGIIKPHVPVICAPQPDEALATIRAIAQENNAPFLLVDPAIAANRPLALAGDHQRINAAVAITATRQLQSLGLATLSTEHTAHGLAHAQWPARLQPLRAGELINTLPTGWQCVIDGGHNEAAARSLASWVRQQSHPVHLVCAMVERKDARGFLAPLAPHVASVTCIDIPDEPLGMPKAALHQAATTLFPAATLAASPTDAIAQITQQHPADSAMILFAGSLYLAGKLLR